MKTSSTAAKIGQFFILASTLLAAFALTAQTASAQIITNGNFETGTLSGWTEVNEAGGSGNFYISTPGSSTPAAGFATASNAEGGSYYAVTDTTGQGSHLLYQSFVVPADTTSLTLTFQMFVNNQAASTYTPASLDYLTSPNQQVRVDIMNSMSTPFSVTSGVVENLYEGTGGSGTHAYTSYSFNLSGLDSSPGTYYLRFAEVDNQGQLNLGIDNVSLTGIQSAPEPSTWALFGIGALGLFVFARSRRRLL